MDLTDRHCRYFHRLLTRRTRLYTEMMTTGALLHGDVPRHLAFNRQERPVALQLGGSEPADLAACARLGEQWGYDEINLNCGCASERVPRTHVAVEIAIAAAVTLERHDEASLPIGWDHANLRVARAFGDAWIRELRTAVLVVPSVVARREGNVMVNPQQPDLSGIVAAAPEPVVRMPGCLPRADFWRHAWRGRVP